MKSNELNEMTVQEACDYAVQKIVEQGKRCVTIQHGNREMCSYGDGQGNHCAWGWLVPEDAPDYAELMSALGTIDELCMEYPHFVDDFNLDTFRALQRFHDSNQKKLREIERAELQQCFGIDTSAPQWQAWVDMGIEEDV